MPYQLNADAFAFAEKLIGDGDYRINTLWSRVAPDRDASARYLDDHGWAAARQWFLAEDPEAPEGSLARLRFPIGDFRSVHRSGLIAARDEAERRGLVDLGAAADELLFFFDRITAC